MPSASPPLIYSDRPEKWQQILADLITDPKELVQLLDLDATAHPAGLLAGDQFPLRVPRPFAARMEKGNWDDPLLRQVWPSVQEEERVAGFSKDPLQEAAFNPLPGLLHKYHGRVLLTAAAHCAVHCRYCFRRHFDYGANSPGRAQWQPALDYIAGDNSVEEVILSGGDPLALADRQLEWLIGQLAAIPHLATLRIHSRLPVVIPQRLSPRLRRLLHTTRLRVVLVVHCNHPREADREVGAHLDALTTNGVVLLNQAVLLKGINDDVDVLTSLNKTLFAHNVLPYYLHLPDAVSGTAHFAVSAEEGESLIAAMRGKLPGYLVPRLVRELPGEAAKLTLA